MLINTIAASLRNSLLKTGKVSIALSGGSSPVALYEGLSSIDLNWARIRVTLIDDRLVPADHDDSNQKLVRSTLMRGRARMANRRNVFSNSCITPFFSMFRVILIQSASQTENSRNS